MWSSLSSLPVAHCSRRGNVKMSMHAHKYAHLKKFLWQKEIFPKAIFPMKRSYMFMCKLGDVFFFFFFKVNSIFILKVDQKHSKS